MVLAELPLLVIDENALSIASELVGQGIIPSKAVEDALHIANPELQRSIATFLDQKGLFLPFICTPRRTFR